MKHALTSFFLVLLFSLGSVWAGTLITGQVEKRQQAKSLAFENLPKRLKTGEFDKIDPNLIENLQARIKNQTCLPSRQLGFFSSEHGEAYAVSSFGGYYNLYYRSDGRLYEIETRTKPTGFSFTEGSGGYPVRLATYSYPNGRLLRARIALARGEDYSFSLDGRLQSFCIDNACYSAEGRFIYFRKTIFECNFTNAGIVK